MKQKGGRWIYRIEWTRISIDCVWWSRMKRAPKKLYIDDAQLWLWDLSHNIPKSIPMRVKVAKLSNYATSHIYSNFRTDPAWRQTSKAQRPGQFEKATKRRSKISKVEILTVVREKAELGKPVVKLKSIEGVKTRQATNWNGISDQTNLAATTLQTGISPYFWVMRQLVCWIAPTYRSHPFMKWMILFWLSVHPMTK